jgi:hypothetical protein
MSAEERLFGATYTWLRSLDVPGTAAGVVLLGLGFVLAVVRLVRARAVAAARAAARRGERRGVVDFGILATVWLGCFDGDCIIKVAMRNCR